MFLFLYVRAEARTLQSSIFRQGCLAAVMRFSPNVFALKHEKAVPQGLKPTLAGRNAARLKPCPSFEIFLSFLKALLQKSRVFPQRDLSSIEFTA
jgi:hypothetical protein